MRRGPYRRRRVTPCFTRAENFQPGSHTQSGTADVRRSQARALAEFRQSVRRIPAARRIMALLRETYLLLLKDLLLELRRRDSLLTMFFFGTLLLFVFHFSFDPAPENVAAMAPALLWLAFLFTGTLGLAQLFHSERENHCLDALLLSPLDRGALFLAKSCFNLVLMVLVEIVVIPLFWILFNLRSWNLLPQLFLVTLLGTVGFCVLGTIMSAVTLRARARELLLPLVLFPLMIPVILATIRCMETVLRTGGLGDTIPWLRLLIGFDVIFLTVGVLIFDWVIES